jgi:molybdopterin synthase sulfur carrier subunit
VTLLFFAQCADWVGARRLDLDAAGPVRLRDLLSGMSILTPLLTRSGYKIAVNRAFADIETEVHHGDEVAFLPPFSGG